MLLVTTVGSATTDAHGVATLTGVSLAGFKAGTFLGVIGASFVSMRPTKQASGVGDLTIAKAAMPTASWLSPADITQGMAGLGHAPTRCHQAPVAGTFVYSPASGTVLSVGQGQAPHGDSSPRADAADFNTITATTKINVAPAPPPPPPPLVTIRGVHEQKLKLSRKKSVEVVVVSFSGALNAADAQGLAAYRIAVAPKKSKAGAKLGAKVILSSAKYDPKAMTVTLTPRKALPTKSLQLSINTALTLDARGRAVDGNQRWSARRGAFVTTFAKAGINLSSIAKATTARGEPRQRRTTLSPGPCETLHRPRPGLSLSTEVMKYEPRSLQLPNQP